MESAGKETLKQDIMKASGMIQYKPEEKIQERNKAFGERMSAYAERVQELIYGQRKEDRR